MFGSPIQRTEPNRPLARLGSARVRLGLLDIMSRNILIVHISSFVRNPLFEILFFSSKYNEYDVFIVAHSFSNMSRSYSIEVRPDGFLSQVDLMPHDADYNSDEDVYESELSGTSTSSTSISDNYSY